MRQRKGEEVKHPVLERVMEVYDQGKREIHIATQKQISLVGTNNGVPVPTLLSVPLLRQKEIRRLNNIICSVM